MRRLFYLALAALAVFELAAVWLIMPLPGSQRMHSVELAYALHRWRWPVRGVLAALALAALPWAWRSAGRRRARWPVAASLAAVGAVAYMTNVRMAADRMFLEPRTLLLRPASSNGVEPERLVVGVELDGEARAYPVRFIGYHHQVRDTLAGRPLLVTFCTVCRTGRVFDPRVQGRAETFRLVGMDHYNAMLEDRSTGTWWRQANGAAVVGPRRGAELAEIPSRQVTLATWLRMHPRSLIMQGDPAFEARYARGYDYESGASRSTLTGTDTVSWRDKAWIVGLTIDGRSRAYDWNRLRRERVINDELAGTPLVVALAEDGASFVAYRRPSASTRFALRGDSLVAPGATYALSGRGATGRLVPLRASQEFWHSWRTFQPATDRY
ncbi:MAG TPA: DUF3179 domain-containing (seleno)protein [Gemmatirosa sp.]|nr:DUF3179 domain-containing (seleno)protein [Gemmatirosa sp.]